MRDMIFISHANPEDNEFTQWIALQLAKEGYPVWCDLTKLLGGEKFWNNIETSIRERTCKFLYVLSKTSNAKEGPLQELQVAESVARNEKISDFIIPLKIDNLPFRETNIQLSRINAISFQNSRAEGLSILLEKFETDNILKKQSFNANAVNTWWRTKFKADKGVYLANDKHLSNWFPLIDLPKNIYFHKQPENFMSSQEFINEFKYPAINYSDYCVSFAEKNDFNFEYSSLFPSNESISYETNSFLDGITDHFTIKRNDARNMVARLLRMGWDNMVIRRNIPTYELSGGIQCLYFKDGFSEGNKAYFVGAKNKETYRQLVGVKTRSIDDGKVIIRYWHYGIQTKPILYPFYGYIVKPHVLFSNDGSNIWESKERLHSARRSQCKNWWNPLWRDRTLASMSWLSDESGFINIEFGSNVILQVSNQPLFFVSPVSFHEPGTEQPSFDTYEDDIDLFSDNILLDE